MKTLRPRSFSELWHPGFFSSVIYKHSPIPNGAFPATSNILDPTPLRTFPTALSWVCTILLLKKKKKKEFGKFSSFLIFNLLILLGAPIYFWKLQRWVNVLGINCSTISQLILFIRMTVSEYSLLNSPKYRWIHLNISPHQNFRLISADTQSLISLICM